MVLALLMASGPASSDLALSDLLTGGVGPNINIVGPTPRSDVLKPDFELRQQNEVGCAFRAGNSEHIFCAYNDYRGANDPEVGDGWPGISQSRNAGASWISRLAPGYSGYGDQDGDGVSESVGRGFAADPVVASAPGLMFHGFIASDRDPKGPGGLYLQRWFESNNEDENSFTWTPEADTILVAPGEVGSFIDKPDIVFALTGDGSASGDTTTVDAVLEGGELISRELPSGTIMMAYTVFNDPEESLREQDVENGNYVNDESLNGVEDMGGTFAVEESPDSFLFRAADDGLPASMQFITPSFGSGSGANPRMVFPVGAPDVLNLTTAIHFQVKLNGIPSRYEFDLGFATLVFEGTEAGGAYSLRYGGTIVNGSSTSNSFIASDEGFGFALNEWVPVSIIADFTANPYENLEALPLASAASGTFVESSDGHFAELGEFDSESVAGSFTVLIDGAPVGVLWADESGNVVETSMPMFEAFPANQAANDTIPVPFPKLAVEIVGEGFGTVFMSMRDLIVDGLARESEVFLTASEDHGESWNRPVRLDGDSQNSSGVRLAYEPSTGETMAIWRRFREAGSGPGGTGDDLVPSGIQSSLSRDLGASWEFQKGLVDAAVDDEICPFDQLAAASAFRTNAFPTLVGDGGGRFLAFWSQRGFAASDIGGPDCALGQSRLVYSIFSDGWSFEGALDNAPDLIGHQVMPHAARSGGRIMVGYWDSRDSLGIFDSFLTDTEDPANPGFFSRQTMTLRALQIGFDGAVSDSLPVSQYLVGDDGSGTLVPLERNYVNLRLFQQGRTPFMGDYISVSGQDFRLGSNGISQGVPDGADHPFFFAWADNRDVRVTQVSLADEATPHAPEGIMTMASMPDGDPQAAKVPASAGENGEKVPEPVVPFDLAELQACVPGDPQSPVRARDQNVYGAMYFPDLQVSSPTPTKQDGAILRAQVVYVRNYSNTPKTYRLTIAASSVGRASFDQFPLPPYDASSPAPKLTLDIGVQALSVAAHSVYIHSATGDVVPVTVTVGETGDCETDPDALCTSGELVLNADPAAPGFRNANVPNPGFRNPGFQNDPLQSESREPEFGEPIITANYAAPGFQNPGFRNPGFRNPGFQNPGFRNATVPNLGVQNPGFRNPGFQNPGLPNPGFQNPGFQNPGFRNPGFQNPGFQNVAVPFNAIANPGFQNPALDGADTSNITDITWPVTNSGNTTSVFDLRPLARNSAPAGTTQLLVTRAHVQPTIRDCVYAGEVRNQVIANIANPDLSGDYDPENQLGDRFGSIAIGPYETVFVTLRIFGETDPEGYGLTAISQACDTDSDICTEDPQSRPRVVDSVGGTISGVLWDDGNSDGVRQEAEPLLIGAGVDLLDASGTVLASRTADALGRYQFLLLPLDESYRVRVTLPPAFGGFSPEGQGSDELLDSDVGSDGLSASVPLSSTAPDAVVDAGVVEQPPGPTLEFCEDPGANRFTDRGLFIWIDCSGTGEIVVEMTGGGTPQRIDYRGRFESSGALTGVAGISLEANDRIDQSEAGVVGFEFIIYNVGLDGVRFSAQEPVCFRPITPGSLPVFIGGDRMPLSFDSVQSDTGLPCGTTMDGDGDGLSDDDEVAIYGTDPDNPDTDGGGVNDGAEVDNGTDPLNPNDDLDQGCGMPIFDASQDQGYFLGKRCNDPANPNRWELTVTGGGARFVRYRGELTVSQPPLVMPVSNEGADFVDSVPGDGLVDFSFGTSRAGTDGFIVDLPAGSSSCFEATDARPVRVGEAGLVMSAPFNLETLGACLGTPPPPPPPSGIECGAPTIATGSEPGLFAWRANCDVPAGTPARWEVRAVGGGVSFTRYQGTMTASTTLVAQLRSIESIDTVDSMPGDGVIDHDLKVGGPGTDGYATDLPATGACFDAGPVFVGRDKTLVNGPFNTASLGPCN